MMAGVERAGAIFCMEGWRWDWAQGVGELVFAVDADCAGERFLAEARLSRFFSSAYRLPFYLKMQMRHGEDRL